MIWVLLVFSAQLESQTIIWLAFVFVLVIVLVIVGKASYILVFEFLITLCILAVIIEAHGLTGIVWKIRFNSGLITLANVGATISKQ